MESKKLTNQRNQCPACGEYFNRTSGFNKHRIGKFDLPKEHIDGRRCMTIDEMVAKGMRVNSDGFWTLPGGENPWRGA